MNRFLTLPLALLSASALAHTPPPSTAHRTTVDASLVATWRSASLVDDNAYWQVPGTMMGGHAWPAEKGAQVDEMNLGLSHRIDDDLAGVLKLGSHAGGMDDHSGVELEHAYIVYAPGPWQLQAGRMSAGFSPDLAQHAAERLASEAPLALDVFFGRHFHDDGARLAWQGKQGVSVGAEVWRGKAFPATDSNDGGAWDLFAQYQWQGTALTFAAGSWFYSAAAEARADHRYGGGHQHVPVAPPGQNTAAFPDIRYTGDTDIAGVHAHLGYHLNNDWQLSLQAEWMRAELDGTVHDAIGRQASLDGSQNGGWVQPGITWRTHTFAVRAERLSTENSLVGPAAPQLATESGLANPDGHVPRRVTALWRWQWRPHIALRAEAIRDESLPAADHRFNIGIVWQQQIWSSADR